MHFLADRQANDVAWQLDTQTPKQFVDGQRNDRLAVNRGEDIARMEDCGRRVAVRGHVYDLDAADRAVKPHPGAIGRAEIGDGPGQALRIHHFISVVECDDESRQKATVNVALERSRRKSALQLELR